MEGISNRMISPCANAFEKTNEMSNAQWFTQCPKTVIGNVFSDTSYYDNNFKQMNNCSNIDVLMITSPEKFWVEVPNIRRYYTQ